MFTRRDFLGTGVPASTLAAIGLFAHSAPAEPPSSKNLEALWLELGTDDKVKAQQAIEALVANPGQTVPFFKERLRPVPQPDARYLAGLIVDLGDARFAVRERATRELDGLGESVESVLKKALAESPSAEARSRIKQLLGAFKTRRLRPPPEQRRMARAIEALELIGSAAAREVLKALAGGAAEAPQTRDARGALERLGTAAPQR
jgi:hypothetical protein